MSTGCVWSIGQGARDAASFCATLGAHGIRYLIDVRTTPVSRYRPAFDRAPLAEALRSVGVTYVFMGDLLGGRPADDTCYVEGRVDYALCRQRPFVQRGVARLQSAVEQGLSVGLFCAEGEPVDCHRFKMIGVALAEVGVDVQHIRPSGEVVGQAALFAAWSAEQGGLFGSALRSRKVYRRP